MARKFTATFWGVRGSAPAMDGATARYGGDTSCVEVLCGERRLVLDLGGGARRLGQELARRPGAPLTLLLSHAHYDHVMGLPCFAPFRMAEAQVLALSPVPGGVAALAAGLMRAPFYPVGPEALTAGITDLHAAPGDMFEPAEGVRLSCAATRHDGGALAWRIDFEGRSLVYAPDHEAGDADTDRTLAHFAAGCDLLIHDATLPGAAPWGRHGHSSWGAAVLAARRAEARRLARFHHHPEA
ncbi:MBL fold metallo-hydrolase, partial [Methylopila musalis]